MFGGQQLLWTAEDAHDPTCYRGQAVSLREGARVQLLMATGRAMAPALHTGDGGEEWERRVDGGRAIR